MAFRFMYSNLWDSGTLTASTEDSNFPATNTRHRWHTWTWRSTTVTTDQWLKLDRGSSSPSITAFIMRYNNFSASATVKIEGNATDSWTTPTYQSTLTVNNEIMVHFPASAQALRWWRIFISDSTNPDGFVEIGRVFLGTYVQLSRNVYYITDDGKEDPSLMTLSEGGQISSVQKTRYRIGRYPFRGLISSDRTSLLAMFDSVGTSKNFFLCEDTSNPNSTSFYVRLAAPITFQRQDSIYSTDLAVEEAR